MRVAIYAKEASPSRQALQGVTPDWELQQVREWAARNSHNVVAEYFQRRRIHHNEGFEFQRLMADALHARHPFDAVVVRAYGRFWRAANGSARHERDLKKSKVRLISITEPDKSQDVLLQAILATFDEYNRVRKNR